MIYPTNILEGTIKYKLALAVYKLDFCKFNSINPWSVGQESQLLFFVELWGFNNALLAKATPTLSCSGQ